MIKTTNFVIVRDLLGKRSRPLKEIIALRKEGYTLFFKLYDDDDILYYDGYMKSDIEDEFIPLDWAMCDSGCTSMSIRNKKTGRMETL